MKNRKIKQFLKKAPVLGSLLAILNRKFIKKKTTPYDRPSNWIRKILQDDEVSIVQIGSNDGVQDDPIYHLIKNNKKWKALFVEPIPYIFEKLKKNYGIDPRFSFENVAINEGTEQIFYSVKEEAKVELPNLPPWYDKLGSFNKQNIIKHFNGILEPYIVETQLSGMSLDKLFRKNDIQNITLLHIDAEGYDWKILSQLDLEKFRPRIILFEHKHLTKSERVNSIKFLKKKYWVFKLRSDYISVLKSDINKEKIQEIKREFKC